MTMAGHPSSHTALVTGATGFVGSHLTRRFVAEGWQVHVTMRPTSSLHPLHSVLDDITVHTHDGTTEGMMAIIKAAQPDVVFHVASLFLASHTPRDICPLLQSNVVFGTQLVEAMVACGVQYLVNTGSSWQHFENKDYSPVCLYAATKQAFEALLQFYVETTPLQVITLKLVDTYGPHDPRRKVFSLLAETAEQQEPLAMSPGEQLVDLVYIDDVVEAYLIAAARLQNDRVAKHERYALSSGSSISLRGLIKLYEQETNITLPIQWGVRPYRSREVMAPTNRGKRLPGWEPTVTLSSGIRKMLKKQSNQS